MKLRWITGIAIALFAVAVLYFLVEGDVFYHAPSPTAKPSPAAISNEIKAAKSGLFNPPKPAIVH